MKVFLSHQKKDREQAKKIADHLEESGIAVYFDEYDQALQAVSAADNPKAVVAAIKKGIKSSTHMLCLVSPNSLQSKWVPFEIGYGYDETTVLALTLKGIKKRDLTDYIRTVRIIRDIYDINIFVRSYGNSALIESKGLAPTAHSVKHPLKGVLDSFAS